VEAKEVAEASAPRGRRPLVLVLQVTTLALVAGLLALLVWRLVVRDNGSQFVSAIAAGKRPLAPGFTLPVIASETRYWPAGLRGAVADGDVSLSQLRGHPVVINFWASWCGPCLDEAPALAAAARRYAGRVVFLGIDHEDLTSDARRFLRRTRAPYVSVRDGNDDVYTAYGLTGTPETYFLDARGRAVAHSAGPVDRATLALGVRSILPR
jgi:cytochrome c biogenesis protein CcmG, thiol:disulfide interchange protein DsbE